MRTETRTSDTRNADSQARDWVILLTNGHATQADADALARWRAEQPAHDLAFRRAQQLWRTTGLATGAPKQVQRQSRRRFIQSAVAASVGLVAFKGATELGYARGLRSVTSDYATLVGERLEVAPASHNRFILDGASTLDLTEADGLFSSRLISGAAYFDVSGGPDKPFVLEVGEHRLVMTDARCLVGETDQSIEISCHSGQVDILAGHALTLTEGEVLRLGGAERVCVQPRNVQEIEGWLKGSLVFTKRRLGDVVTSLNRHRRGKIILARRDLAERPVTGVFYLDRSEDALETIVETLSLSATWLPAGIVILS